MAKKSYNFTSNFSKPISLSISESINSLIRIDQSDELFNKMTSIEDGLKSRFDNSKATQPEINGKSLNPIVLGMVAYKNSFESPYELDSMLKASKEFSSFETSAGRIVEDIFPMAFGYETVNTAAHDPFSEIDCMKKSCDTTQLIALKSGPACINDTMSNKIGTAIAEHNSQWFDRYQTKNITFTIGMNYSSSKMSNKKDWHAIRIAEEIMANQGFSITESCLVDDKAISYFSAQRGSQNIKVQTLQGKKLWDYITEHEDGFALLNMALTRASILDPKIVKASEVFTKNLTSTLEVSRNLKPNFDRLNSKHLEWFFLFSRHFVDNFSE